MATGQDIDFGDEDFGDGCHWLRGMEEAGIEFLLDAVDRFPLLEEFAKSRDHPDPLPLVVVVNSGVGVAVPADSVADSDYG